MKIKTINNNELDVLTRRQVMELWSHQTTRSLDSPVCPNCRDILVEDSQGLLFCANSSCSFLKRIKEGTK
jgi:hypothetical protein